MQSFKENNRRFTGGGRDWSILIISLLLAFFMWSLQKLSYNYSSYFKYKVDISSDITGRVNRAVSTDVLLVSAKSSGFKILQNYYGADDDVLKIEQVDKKLFHRYNSSSDIFYILSQEIRQKVQDALGNDMQLEDFATDTLYFNFPLQAHKKVPVVAKSVITYKDQYMPFHNIILKPDSIYIYGNIDIINRVDSLETNIIHGEKVSELLSGMVTIAPIKGVRYSNLEVLYTQDVGRYVENTINVPVVVKNAPSSKNIAVVPQQVTINYRQMFAGAREKKISDFVIAVDYNQILLNNVVKPYVERKPKEVVAISIEPKFVECIL